MNISVSLAQILKVKPQAVIKFLLVPLGTRVKKGDLLARKKGFLGKKIEVRAEVAGKLESLSSATGELLISAEETESGIEKSKEGKVKTDGEKGDTDEAETLKKPRRQKKSSAPSKDSGRLASGVFGFGQGKGQLVVFSDCLEFTKLNKKLEGKVIFAPSIGGIACLFKASALEVEGLVLAFLNDSDEEIKKEVAGKVSLGFLVLGETKDEKIIEKVKKWEGKKVRVEGEKREIHLISND